MCWLRELRLGVGSVMEAIRGFPWLFVGVLVVGRAGQCMFWVLDDIPFRIGSRMCILRRWDDGNEAYEALCGG